MDISEGPSEEPTPQSSTTRKEQGRPELASYEGEYQQIKEQIKKMIAEKLLKQSKRYKRELITLKRKMRNMVNIHKKALTAMETEKDESILILHEIINELNRERCQIEDDLIHRRI